MAATRPPPGTTYKSQSLLSEISGVLPGQLSNANFMVLNACNELISPANACLHLHGELDLDAQPILCRAIDQMLKNEVRILTLELSFLKFIDCSGLTVLIAVNNLLIRRSGIVILRSPNTSVRRLLELTGLISSFLIE
jgi:anti-anti-sigma factor